MLAHASRNTKQENPFAHHQSRDPQDGTTATSGLFGPLAGPHIGGTQGDGDQGGTQGSAGTSLFDFLSDGPLARPQQSPGLTPEQLAKAVQENRSRHLNKNTNPLRQVRAHFNLPPENTSDEPLALAVCNHQIEKGRAGTGTLDEQTMKDLKGEGLGTPEWGKKLDERDRKLIAEERKQWQRPEMGDARARIVGLAQSQVGQTNYMNRGDGTRYGGARLEEYFSVFDNKGNISKSEYYREGRNPANTSWCGLFAVWVVSAVNSAASWGERKVQGLPSFNPQQETPRPGDILYIENQNHHFICTEATGTGTGMKIHAVAGNADFSGVCVQHYSRSQLVGGYRSVNDAAPAQSGGAGGQGGTQPKGGAEDGPLPELGSLGDPSSWFDAWV